MRRVILTEYLPATSRRVAMIKATYVDYGLVRLPTPDTDDTLPDPKATRPPSIVRRYPQLALISSHTRVALELAVLHEFAGELEVLPTLNGFIFAEQTGNKDRTYVEFDPANPDRATIHESQNVIRLYLTP